MPIDYSKYHPYWKVISLYIRIFQAKNRCEKCGIANKSVGFWVDGEFIRAQDWADTLLSTGEDLYKDVKKKRLVTVVLTVAHLDQDIDNNEFSNLMALCQRCHLGHDRLHNIRKRWEKRHRFQYKLFE